MHVHACSPMQPSILTHDTPKPRAIKAKQEDNTRVGFSNWREESRNWTKSTGGDLAIKREGKCFDLVGYFVKKGEKGGVDFVF